MKTYLFFYGLRPIGCVRSRGSSLSVVKEFVGQHPDWWQERDVARVWVATLPF